MKLSSSLMKCMMLHICHMHVLPCGLECGQAWGQEAKAPAQNIKLLHHHTGVVTSVKSLCGQQCLQVPHLKFWHGQVCGVQAKSQGMKHNNLHVCAQMLICSLPRQDVSQASPSHQVGHNGTNRHRLQANSMAGTMKSAGCLPCLLALGV